MAFYIAATAKIVNVDTEEVINTGATIYSATNSRMSLNKKTLTIGGTLTYSTGSTYYQYWEAEIEDGYTFDHFNVTTTSYSGNEPPKTNDFTENPTGQWSFRQTSSQHQSQATAQPYTITLYVHVTPVTKTVTLNPNGGTVSPTTIECTVGETYGTLPTPQYSGNTFNGWFDAQTGGNEITGQTEFTASSPTTLYAHWTPTPVGTFTLTFNDNGGSGGPGTVSVNEGDSYTIPSTPPTKTDYTFEYWLSGSIQYQLGETVTPTENMDFLAIWSGGPHPPRPEEQKDYMVRSSSSDFIVFSVASGSMVYAV